MRNSALFIACLTAALAGCEPDEPLVAVASQQLAPVCQVTVQGGSAPEIWGAKDVESDYLPRVLWCETRHLPPNPELLLADAIVVRTQLYQRVRQAGRVANGEGDKLYFAAECSGPVPAAYRDAVAQTAGQVLVRPESGALHAGISAAGETPQCQKVASCGGEPCLGLQEASSCAASGYDHGMIIRMFFDNPVIAQARGRCDGASGQTAATCATSGQRGTCQPAGAACSGVTVGGLCPGDAMCCLPPFPAQPAAPGAATPAPTSKPPAAPPAPAPTETYGACSYKGFTGVCQPLAAPCAGINYTNVCQNVPADVHCCLPPEARNAPTTSAESMYYGKSCDAGRGTCQSRASYSCASGSWKSGLCPGSADVQCCATAAAPQSYGACSYQGHAGTCQDRAQTSCAGMWKTGLCPGGASIQCCVP